MAGPKVTVTLSNKGAGKAMLDIENNVRAPVGVLLVGINPNRRYYVATSSPGKTKPRRKPVPIVRVAAWNEYGIPGKLPSRPAIQTALEANAARYKNSLEARLGIQMSTLRATEQSMAQTMGALGAMIVADIKKSIIGWTDPPNAQYTIDKKGFDNPLEDLGRLSQAFEHSWIPGKQAANAAVKRAARSFAAFKGTYGPK